MSKERKKAFEILILGHEEEKNDQGVVINIQTNIVVPSTLILATNAEEAKFAAHRLVPEDWAEEPELLELRIRPF